MCSVYCTVLSELYCTRCTVLYSVYFTVLIVIASRTSTLGFNSTNVHSPTLVKYPLDSLGSPLAKLNLKEIPLY